MPLCEFACEVEAPLERVWTFHNEASSLLLLTSPAKQAHFVGECPPMGLGALYRLRVVQFGFLPLQMSTRIVEYTPPWGFVDQQEKGPFGYWRHAHRFERMGSGRTRLYDRVEYEMPLGALGSLVDRLLVRRDIEQLFAYRHRRTRELLGAPAN